MMTAPNPRLPQKPPFKCPECQRTYASGGSVTDHVRQKHWEEWESKYRVKQHRRATNGVANDLTVMGMVAKFFPRGIPTDDPAQLLQDLYFIDDLRTRARSK